MTLWCAVARRLTALVTLVPLFLAGCGGVFGKNYEYEEELFLYLDGSATLNVNSSTVALVALRGVDLDVSPDASITRDQVERLFEGPGRITRVRFSRRAGRQFVHVTIDVDDVTDLSGVGPLAWSTYEFRRTGDVFDFHQVVGVPVGAAVPDVGWTGDELVAFRIHVPSEIPFHNSPGGVLRGNILEWEQPLRDRLAGDELDLQVSMEADSILYTTLILFGSTIVAAAFAFGGAVWWLRRRGRPARIADPA